MARAHVLEYIQDDDGNALPGATVRVQDPDTGLDISSMLYSAQTGGTTLANPLTAGTYGRIDFWLEGPQQLQLQISYPGRPTVTIVVDALSWEGQLDKAILVAASNSPSRVKYQAQYRCNGSNDAAQILAAITAALSDGVPLVLGAGTFTMETPVAVSGGSRQVRLLGQGWETEVRPAAGIAGATPMLSLSGDDGPVVSNLFLNGVGINVPLLKIAGNNAQSGYISGIRAHNYLLSPGAVLQSLLQLGAVACYTVRDSFLYGWSDATHGRKGMGIELVDANQPTTVWLYGINLYGLYKGIGQSAGHLNGSAFHLYGGRIDDCIEGFSLGGHHIMVSLDGVRFEVSLVDLTTAGEIAEGHTAAYGIKIAGTTSTEASHWQGLSVQRCYFTGFDTAAKTGVYLAGVNGASIQHNTFKGTTLAALGKALELGSHVHRLSLGPNTNAVESALATSIVGYNATLLAHNDWTKRQDSLDIVSDGARKLLETTVGVGGVEAIDFDISALQGHRHLLLEIYPRGDRAGVTNDLLGLRLSTDGTTFDTGNNYDYQYTRGIAAAADAAEGLAQSYFLLGAMPAADAPANTFGAYRVDLLDYAQATNNKSLLWSGSLKASVVSGGLIKYDGAGWWRNNAAIKGIRLQCTGGEKFSEGARVTLYGLP